MTIKTQLHAFSILALLLSSFHAAAASPWRATDGATLQVTSGYASTEFDDIPLQVSGAGSQLITNSGLSFSSSVYGTSVAKVTDQGSLTLNNATLTVVEGMNHGVAAESGTFTLNGGSLFVSGFVSYGISARSSSGTITDTTISVTSAGGGLVVYGGSLIAENIAITGDSVGRNVGIDIWRNGDDYGQVTLNNSTITLVNEQDAQAINIHNGHLTGSNLTINSATQVYAAIRVGDNVGARSSLTLSDSTINTGFIGIRVMGGNATLNNVNIVSDSPKRGAYALDVSSNADVIVRGGSYSASGEYGGGVWLPTANTTLDAADTIFSTSGSYSHAVNAQYGSAALTNGTLLTLGTESHGIYTQNSVRGSGLAITTAGRQSYGVMTANGQITLNDSAVATSGMYGFGVAATAGAKLLLDEVTIDTSGYAASGALLQSGSELQMDNVRVTTNGDSAYGVQAQNATATLVGSDIATHGQNAHGVAATHNGAVNISDGEITVYGDTSAGMYAAGSAAVTADNVTITASGDNSFGLIAALGDFKLSNSTIANTGTATASDLPGAAGLYADTWSADLQSTVTLDNVTLTSEAGPGVRVQGSTLDLILDNNTQIYGGDGTALNAVVNKTSDGVVQAAKVTVTADNQSQLLGSVITDSYDNAVSLTLNNGSTLNGATQNVSQLILNSASRWLINDSSNVKSLSLNSGSVVFNNASSFSTLTVDGDLTGSGAFYFNALLGDDSSASDRLLIGGDASGAYEVNVNNRGGTGMQTDAGILLIKVAGDASSASFNQKAAVVAGNYEYYLYKIGDNSWYLQSSLVPVEPGDESGESSDTDITPQPGDNSDTDITPQPDDNGGNTVTPDNKAYRAETAGYLIAPYLNSVYGFATVASWHERMDAYQGETVWARVSGGHDRYSAGRFAFNVNTSFVQFGGDVLQKSADSGWNFAAGPMMTLGHQLSSNKDTARRLRSDLSIDVGKTDTTAYGIGGYLTAWHDDGAYLDNVLQVTRYSNEFSSQSHAKMDSYGVVVSVEAGMPFSLGGQFRLEPQLQAMGQYMNLSQTYSSGVKLKDQNLTTARLREGLRFFYDNPLFQPYLQADAVQFLGHTPGIDMNNEKIRPDVRRGYWQASAGLGSQLNAHLGVYAQIKYSHSFGPGTEGYSGNMGLRYRF